MVYFALLVGAELDGLTNLQPRRGCDNPNFPYYLKLKCENCGEVTAKSTYVTLSEQVDLPKGHGTAHLVQKCKLCERDGTIVMIPGHGTPLTTEQSQKEEKTCLMVFDCRGYEPVEFSFGAGWKAESVHGTPFEIDCSEGEFSEYDEKGEYPVELSKLQSTFKVVKKPEKGFTISHLRLPRFVPRFLARPTQFHRKRVAPSQPAGTSQHSSVFPTMGDRRVKDFSMPLSDLGEPDQGRV